ncbi:GDSL-type esterase/lipase family protein [Methylomonas rosea]|uniref:GDSL-type esterase/lipase family protein n=1 Tax=Methylomonas rosea TaxID=2952227 RepID=A0ABT1TP28_9GAMM|nr:GDSL-type esterase/lipase family protein [Methylomonas sp. WSC-7]MCQ8116237.1 GDSL-type esterase/lipase family protein [Methylomonas sp. WSC-7]
MKIFLIAVALLCGCMACNRSAPTMSKLPDNAVILAFGDSLTYGTGASAQHDYPSVLAQMSGREVINEGVPGELSAQGRQRLPALLDEYRPDLLILIHGGNDILQQIAAEQTRDNLKAMIAEARQRNIPIVILGVPAFGVVFLRSAKIYEEIAASEGVPSDLDTVPNILANNALKSDAVHPNDSGYRHLAENIAALLQKHGAL